MGAGHSNAQRIVILRADETVVSGALDTLLLPLSLATAIGLNLGISGGL